MLYYLESNFLSLRTFLQNFTQPCRVHIYEILSPVTRLTKFVEMGGVLLLLILASFRKQIFIVFQEKFSSALYKLIISLCSAGENKRKILQTVPIWIFKVIKFRGFFRFCPTSAKSAKFNNLKFYPLKQFPDPKTVLN